MALRIGIVCLLVTVCAARFSSATEAKFQPVIHGLVAAPFTPFKEDLSVNLDAIPMQVDSLIGQGVLNAYVCGTTGESLKLTKTERMSIAEAWMNASKGTALNVIIHVGAESQEDARDLAAHAQSIGAYAIGMMPPTFFKPATIPQLVSWCAAVSAAAPKLPFLYYHIPSMTGVEVVIYDFLTAAQGQIPMLAGVKFTDYNLYDFARSVHFGENNTVHGPFTMLYGRDEQVLGALTMQADGAVGSTYNFNGNCANRLIKFYQDGDIANAQLEQSRIQAVVALLGKYGGGTGKAIMKLKGWDMGEPRPPTIPLTSAQVTELKEDLDSIGFFQWS